MQTETAVGAHGANGKTNENPMMALPTGTPAKLARQAVIPTGVKSQFLVITPEMAKRLLEANTHNRPLRKRSLIRYAADIKAGRWLASHQGIAIAENNVIIDGQHRLHAIVEANVPATMMLTTGLPLSTQVVVDNVIPRSVVDIMSVSDRAEGMSSMHAAAAIRMFHGLGTKSATLYRTRIEEVNFVKAHWEAIDFAVKLFPVNRRVRGVTVAPVMAAVAKAFYHENHQVLRRAAEVLVTGVNNGQLEYGLIQLREMLRNQAGSQRASNRPEEIYAKVVRVLHAFCKRTPIGRNIIPATTDPWPLPTLTGRPRSN